MKISVHDSSGLYGVGFLQKDKVLDVDADRLVALIAKPVLAQHIPNDERLIATINAITKNLVAFIREKK